MAPFRFKIKGYLNEAGEYSQMHEAESGTILQFILQHWFNETLPNNLDIVLIENQNGDRLIIDHVTRDIFEYYFIEKSNPRSYYFKKTDIQFMFFVLECFFNNQSADLKHNLRASTDNNKFVRGDYSGKSFVYSVTNKSLFRNLFMLVVSGLIVVGIIGFSLFTSPFLAIFGVVFFLVIAVSMTASIRRVKSYYNDNKDISLRISRGDDFIHVTKGTWSQSIPKSDIRHILKYIGPPNDDRDVSEYHTEVEFINGNILNITCLLMPQDQIENKFANDPVPIEFKTTPVKKLPRSTNLDKYFSAIKPLGTRDPVR